MPRSALASRRLRRVPRPGSSRRALARLRFTLRREGGQATVELCALLPLIGVLVLGLWQLAVWGQATWAAADAARAAARAEAVGGDAEAAARRALPGRFEEGLRVAPASDGGAEVRVRVPMVAGGGRLITVTERARFAPQGG